MQNATPVIAAGVTLLALAAITVAVVFTRHGIVVKSGLMSNCVSYVWAGSWTTRASRIDGHCRLDKTLDGSQLAALRVSGTHSSGRVLLTMTQGHVEQAVELTGGFDDRLDMSAFQPGRVRMRVDYHDAAGVIVAVSWS